MPEQAKSTRETRESARPRASRRGPRPMPTARRLAEGNRQRRPLNDLEPTAPAIDIDELPPPPDHLTSEAKRLWTETFGPQVIMLRVMTEADWTALELLCMSRARVLALERFVQEHTTVYTVVNKDGEVREHTRPQFTQLRQEVDNTIKLLREFGLTPSSRPKIQTVSRGDGNGPSKFFG